MTIVEEDLVLDMPNGKMRSVVFRPKGEGRFPCLVLYSEIFQLTGPILRSAAMMAGHGFMVAVPEIYYEHLKCGEVLAYDDEGKTVGNDLKIKTPLQNYDMGLNALVQHFKKDQACSGQFGSMGFCLGGHLAFRAALHSEVKAIASFYGTDIHSSTLGPDQACDSFARIEEMETEFLMVWGRQDPHIPKEGRQKIYNELCAKERSFTWHEFNAVHAFMRDEGERYNPSLAAQGYQLAVDLFNRVLK